MAVADMHPDIADLEAFTLGTLDDASLANVEAHVADCPTCQERAAGASGDTLVELLRRVHAQAARGDVTVAEAAGQAPTPAPVPADRRPFHCLPLATSAAGTEAVDVIPPELARHERYRVRRLLGAGGMGSVYEAEHRVMQRRGGGEGDQPRLHDQPGRRGALPPRGPRRRPAVAPEHRQHPRRRGRRPLALPGDGIRRGHQPRPAGEGTRPAAGGRGVRLRPAGGAGVAARPRARHGPPRHQARQPDARGEPGCVSTGSREGPRFRPGGADGGTQRRPDRHERHHGHARLHGPRAGRGRSQGRHPRRRVQPRLHALLPADRAASPTRRTRRC